MSQTVILDTPRQRKIAAEIIAIAPQGAVVTVKAASRTTDQNAKFYAMLSDISRAKPEGKRHTPDTWKALLMKACGHAVQFVNGLDGEPFPIGFRSSRLSKEQMSELIEFAYFYGAQHGVAWSDEARDER